MKIILINLLLIFFTLGSIAQNITVKGKVLDNSKTPLTGVSIHLKDSKKGAETDFEGNFEIRGTQKKQILVFSYIGYKTKEIIITDKTDLGNIILFEGNELLQEVVLKGRKNKFSRKATAYVSKLPLKDLENSHVYTTVTSALLESQVVTNLDEAMTNATGIYKLWEGTGRAPGNGTAFFSSRGFSVQPRMVDGVAGVTFSAIDPSYIERIEV